MLVVVDGRQSSSSGMTMLELAQFMAGRLGVQVAMNLDGGGSSTLAVKGAVANHPEKGSNARYRRRSSCYPDPDPTTPTRHLRRGATLSVFTRLY